MYRVALVTITRDDARCVERALLSARDFVDELVVLDLGSVDDTLERARRCGARIETADWNPDPALVRNTALARAGADWHVVLEAGEWVDGGGDDLRALGRTPPDRVGLVETIPGLAGRGLAPTSLEARLLPGSVRYAGRYRDEAVHPGLRTWKSAVVVAGDEPDRRRWRHDRVRGEAALRQALAIYPRDPRLLAQLGEALRDRGEASEAADAYLAALAGTAVDEPWRHQFVVESLDALRAAKRFTDALRLMDLEVSRWPQSPDFAFVVGGLFFDILLLEPAQSAQLAPLAEAAWRRCLDIGERADLIGTVTGRGSFLAAQHLAVLHRTLGNEEQARGWLATASALRVVTGSGRQHRPLS